MKSVPTTEQSQANGNGGAHSAPGLQSLTDALPVSADQLRQADERFRAAVREHPFLALGAALGAGYMLGLTLRKLTR